MCLVPAILQDSYVRDLDLNSKRSKIEPPSGLVKGYRKDLKKKKVQVTDEGNDCMDEYNGGVFDQDDDADAVSALRRGKKKGYVRGLKVWVALSS